MRACLPVICAKMMVWKIIYKKKFFFFYFHIREILCHSWESGFISGRLPDDLGGMTCTFLFLMVTYFRLREKMTRLNKLVSYMVVPLERLEKYNVYRYIIYQSNWSGPFSLVVVTPN